MPQQKKAQKPLKRLEFMTSNLNGVISPSHYNKLVEVVNLSKEASGQVQNKDHWLSNTKQAWTFFERLIKNELNN